MGRRGKEGESEHFINAPGHLRQLVFGGAGWGFVLAQGGMFDFCRGVQRF